MSASGATGPAPTGDGAAAAAATPKDRQPTLTELEQQEAERQKNSALSGSTDYRRTPTALARFSRSQMLLARRGTRDRPGLPRRQAHGTAALR